jgi:hypothetical protein
MASVKYTTTAFAAKPDTFAAEGLAGESFLIHQAASVASVFFYVVGGVRSDQSFVHQSLSDDLRHYKIETASIICPALIESERLLINIAVKMWRIDRNVCPVDCALQQAPKILHAIRVNMAVNICLGVVNHIMDVFDFRLMPPSGESVGIEIRSRLNGGSNYRQERFLFHVGNNLGPNLAAALQNAVNDCLASAAGPLDGLLATAKVYVLCLSANKCLIRFHPTAELFKRSDVHRMTNPVEHVPSAFLGNLERPRQFATADTILGIGNGPYRDKPLVETERAILENRANFDRKLFAAILRFALHQATAGNISDVSRAAFRASGLAIGPFDLDHVHETNIEIRVVSNGFQKRLGAMYFSVHTGIIRPFLRCVKYINALIWATIYLTQERFLL